MATFDAPFHEAAFEQMEAQRKTLYAVVAAGEFAHIVSGDRLEFGEHGSITIGMVRRYPSLEALVEAQGHQSLVPDAAEAAAAIEAIRSQGEWSAADEQAHGILALRVREARRKI